MEPGSHIQASPKPHGPPHRTSLSDHDEKCSSLEILITNPPAQKCEKDSFAIELTRNMECLIETRHDVDVIGGIPLPRAHSQREGMSNTPREIEDINSQIAEESDRRVHRIETELSARSRFVDLLKRQDDRELEAAFQERTRIVDKNVDIESELESAQHNLKVGQKLLLDTHRNLKRRIDGVCDEMREHDHVIESNRAKQMGLEDQIKILLQQREDCIRAQIKERALKEQARLYMQTLEELDHRCEEVRCKINECEKYLSEHVTFAECDVGDLESRWKDRWDLFCHNWKNWEAWQFSTWLKIEFSSQIDDDVFDSIEDQGVDGDELKDHDSKGDIKTMLSLCGIKKKKLQREIVTKICELPGFGVTLE